MATPKSCSKCEKGTGAYYCVGCEAYFCKRDYQQHREKMANQLDGFIENRNELQEQINKVTDEKGFRSPLLAEIDDWQRTTIEKVEKVAKQARQQVIELLNSKKVNIKSRFANFSQELIQLKETEDFVEYDLKRLEQTVHQLNEELTRLSAPPEIELCMEQSNQIAWDTLIYVKEKPSFAAKQQRQQPGKTPISSHQKQLDCSYSSICLTFD
jgi:chromosome segregation ATPase